MLAERLLTRVVKTMTKNYLALDPAQGDSIPQPDNSKHYMLYMHVPFCQQLCPYCSFNRYPFHKERATRYFQSLRKEMMMLKERGYDFETIYVGGGTPTILIDELTETLDLARDQFSIKEVSCETNPNHLTESILKKLSGRVQRLSVGVQSFDDGLLKQMDRYNKYGSGEKILEHINLALPYVDSLNVDMIFNFPQQTEDILISDIEKIAACGCRQVTFSPLYVSHATTRKMAETLGEVNRDREARYYRLIDEILAEGSDALFERTTLWTFNRKQPQNVERGMSAHGQVPSRAHKDLMVEEYAVEYEQYPAIGSGSIAHLNGTIYVNTFSLEEYNQALDEGKFPLMGKTRMSKRNLMRYRLLINLYNLRLDKQQFKRDFGVSIERALPVELAFLRSQGAFETDSALELTLSPKGRYLVLVMYRQFLSGMNNLRDQARAALSGPERELLFGDGKPCEAMML